ncbi:thiopurine S-methyltransferase [Alloalcanivorax marinus]|uniref:thiopurine S-methyltransferase n=1 Tax=Alloalcanivorax marinus TaxID=1177169 RepID=UPI0019338548|nr:thiopurine S-methyltransferase [Alloalcanivorax marinus]MBL7250992.1 thiopurine S-methyltransferase [Alloalcanivorax marinus]
MESAFWKDKWQKQELGFHLPFVNPVLKRNLPAFDLAEGARVFVPLCGKTLDMGWLLAQGHRVVGAELSELAVRQLFEELGVAPEVDDWAGGQRWRHGELTVFQGDLFQLTAEQLGPVDLVYDRAALVALPEAMRARYAPHLRALTGAAPQLLIAFEYDPAEMDGPPFPVFAEEVRRLYQDHYTLRELSRQDVIENQDRFKEAGVTSFVQVAWKLNPLAAV